MLKQWSSPQCGQNNHQWSAKVSSEYGCLSGIKIMPMRYFLWISCYLLEAWMMCCMRKQILNRQILNLQELRELKKLEVYFQTDSWAVVCSLLMSLWCLLPLSILSFLPYSTKLTRTQPVLLQRAAANIMLSSCVSSQTFSWELYLQCNLSSPFSWPYCCVLNSQHWLLFL